MTLCPNCIEYAECKEICPAVQKEITGRGKTASRKRKTYPVDFSYIENTHQSLNSFQREVLYTLKNLTLHNKEQSLSKLEIEEAINESLNDKEKEVIFLFMQSYRQEDIAQRLNISQPRVNFLFKRALRKLRIFLLGGYKTPQKTPLPMEGGKGSEKKCAE